MARTVTYSVVPRYNPNAKNEPPRYYARAQASGEMTLREMAETYPAELYDDESRCACSARGDGRCDYRRIEGRRDGANGRFGDSPDCLERQGLRHRGGL